MLTKSTTANTFYIPELNGLRAVSILLVLINHAYIKGPLNNMPAPLVFLVAGGVGVNIFFVISGYLITMLLMREEALTHTIHLKKFYLRRMLRIFPAYYTFLLICLLLQFLHVLQLPPASWVTSVTFTKYFNKFDWPTKHLWSLSVEEHFYLLWPLGFIYLKNKTSWLLLIIMVLVPAARVINTFYLDTVWMDDISFFQRCDAIACGCLLALHYNKVTAFINRLLQKSRVLVLLPPCTFALLMLFTKLNMVQPKPGVLFTAFGTTTGLFADAAIIMLIVISIHYKTPWQRLLNLHIVNYIGKISYGIYLWQQLFFSPWQQQFFSLHLGTVASLLLNIACITLAASASYYLIEKPFLQLKAKYAVTGAT